MKNRKVSIALFLALLVVIGSLSGCGKQSEKATANSDKAANVDSQRSNTNGLVIRVADFPTAVWNDQLKIAVKNGYFKEEFAKDNISVEVKEFANGPAVNEAFTAKKLDFVTGIGDQPLLTGIANGLNLRVLSAISIQEKTIGLLVPVGSKVKQVEELKGKKIGVYIGTFYHKSLLRVLKDHGLTEADVELVNLSNGNDGLAALNNGNVDAYLANEPFVTNAVDNGIGRQIIDITGHPAITFAVAQSEFTKNYPEITKKFLKVLNKAHKWSLENPEKAYELLAGATNLKTSQVKSINERTDRSLGLSKEVASQIQDTYVFLIEQKLIRNKLNIADYIDTSFIEKVFKEEGK